MSVAVRLPDGREITVETDDPQAAARAGRLFWEREQREAEPGYQAAAERERQLGEVQQRTQLPGVGEWTRQLGRNMGIGDELAGGGAALTQFGSNAIRTLTGRPIVTTPSQAYHAAADRESDRQRAYAREHPLADAGATIASVPLFMGRAPAAVPQMPAWQAGLGFGAINAPFAIGRQEGTLAERSRQAAPEIGTATFLGAGGQALSNALTRHAPAATQRLQDFESAGVRPTMAAVSGGPPAAVTKIAAESLVGGSTQRSLQASIDDTQHAAERLSSSYANAGTPELTGEGVRAGVQRWATDANTPPLNPPLGEAWRTPTRDWGFRAKANALYEHVEGEIARLERAVGGRLIGSGSAPRVTTQATARVLDDTLSRAGSPELDRLVGDPAVRRMAEALRADEGAVRFNGLRALRSWVREQQFDGLLRNVNQGALQRLEAALTDDILRSATNIAGPRAAHALRRVDTFYRAGMQRISRALNPFIATQGTGMSAYQRILTMASERGGANTAALQSLKRTLRPDEWRQVAATIINELGSPSPGAVGAVQQGAFSVANFVTNWNKLSPQGRRALFGSIGGGGQAADDLARQLDTLARVADYQKGVEALANSSRSGVHGSGFATIGGIGAGLAAAATGNIAPLAGVLAGLGALRLTGEMLTNPGFVRWLASAPKAGRTVGGAREHLARLLQLASRDPALMPAYTELTRAGLSSVRDRQRSPPQSQPTTQAPPSTPVLEMTER